MSTLNSKQRVLEAMNHREPDRVPVMCQLALGHYFLNCDYSPSQIWFDSETFAKALVDLQQRYEFDGILVNLPGRPPDWETKLKSYKKVDNKTEMLILDLKGNILQRLYFPLRSIQPKRGVLRYDLYVVNQDMLYEVIKNSETGNWELLITDLEKQYSLSCAAYIGMSHLTCFLFKRASILTQ